LIGWKESFPKLLVIFQLECWTDICFWHGWSGSASCCY